MQNQEQLQQRKPPAPPSEPAPPAPEPLGPSPHAEPEPLVPPSEPLIQPQEQSDGAAPVAAEPGAEERLAAAQAALAEMQDAFLRARAETDNVRRRVQDDIARAHKYAIENFAEAMLPVKDSLEAALRVDTPSVASLKEGVEMTLKQLDAAFARNRLSDIAPEPGARLDPARHQAISLEAAEQSANTVVSVLQKGYMIGERLLRPALVTVAQEKADADGA